MAEDKNLTYLPETNYEWMLQAALVNDFPLDVGPENLYEVPSPQ